MANYDIKGYDIIKTYTPFQNKNEVHAVVRKKGAHIGQEEIIILKSPRAEEVGMKRGGFISESEARELGFKKSVATANKQEAVKEYAKKNLSEKIFAEIEKKREWLKNPESATTEQNELEVIQRQQEALKVDMGRKKYKKDSEGYAKDVENYNKLVGQKTELSKKVSFMDKILAGGSSLLPSQVKKGSQKVSLLGETSDAFTPYVPSLSNGFSAEKPSVLKATKVKTALGKVKDFMVKAPPKTIKPKPISSKLSTTELLKAKTKNLLDDSKVYKFMTESPKDKVTGTDLYRKVFQHKDELREADIIKAQQGRLNYQLRRAEEDYEKVGSQFSAGTLTPDEARELGYSVKIETLEDGSQSYVLTSPIYKKAYENYFDKSYPERLAQLEQGRYKGAEAIIGKSFTKLIGETSPEFENTIQDWEKQYKSNLISEEVLKLQTRQIKTGDELLGASLNLLFNKYNKIGNVKNLLKGYKIDSPKISSLTTGNLLSQKYNKVGFVQDLIKGKTPNLNLKYSYVGDDINSKIGYNFKNVLDSKTLQKLKGYSLVKTKQEEIKYDKAVIFSTSFNKKYEDTIRNKPLAFGAEVALFAVTEALVAGAGAGFKVGKKVVSKTGIKGASRGIAEVPIVARSINKYDDVAWAIGETELLSKARYSSLRKAWDSKLVIKEKDMIPLTLKNTFGTILGRGGGAVVSYGLPTAFVGYEGYKYVKTPSIRKKGEITADTSLDLLAMGIGSKLGKESVRMADKIDFSTYNKDYTRTKIISKRDTPVRSRATIIYEDVKTGKILYSQDKNSGMWMLVGGDVKKGETALKAARREALEETGLNVNLKQIDRFVTEREEYIVFHAKVDASNVILKPQAKEISQFSWLNPTKRYVGGTPKFPYGKDIGGFFQGERFVRGSDLYASSRFIEIKGINLQYKTLSPKQLSEKVMKGRTKLSKEFGEESISRLTEKQIFVDSQLLEKNLLYKRLELWRPQQTFKVRGKLRYLKKRVPKFDINQPSTYSTLISRFKPKSIKFKEFNFKDFEFGLNKKSGMKLRTNIKKILPKSKAGEFAKFQDTPRIDIAFGSRYDISREETLAYAQGQDLFLVRGSPTAIQMKDVNLKPLEFKFPIGKKSGLRTGFSREAPKVDKQFQILEKYMKRGEPLFFWQPSSTPKGDAGYLGGGYLGGYKKSNDEFELFPEISFWGRKPTMQYTEGKVTKDGGFILSKKALRTTELEIGTPVGYEFRLKKQGEDFFLSGDVVQSQRLELLPKVEGAMSGQQVEKMLGSLGTKTDFEKKSILKRIEKKTGVKGSYVPTGKYASPLELFKPTTLAVKPKYKQSKVPDKRLPQNKISESGYVSTKSYVPKSYYKAKYYAQPKGYAYNPYYKKSDKYKYKAISPSYNYPYQQTKSYSYGYAPKYKSDYKYGYKSKSYSYKPKYTPKYDYAYRQDYKGGGIYAPALALPFPNKPSTKKKKKKKLKYSLYGYTPSFTAKALDISFKKTPKDIMKLMTKRYTGLELRKIIK